jgi:arabinose-5-phosphate isomerase
VDYIARAREILDIEREGLERVRDGLGQAFTDTIAFALESLGAGKKVVITGVGKNLPIAQKMAATFTSTGSPAVVLHPSEAVHGDLGILSEGDVLIVLSYSGETDELINLLPLARRQPIRIVLVSGQADCPLARYSDRVLSVAVDREACPFNMAPTASTTATLALGDALAMVLIEARGFTRDDYAKLHPGGSIGRTLLLKVSDIMRKGDDLRTVRPTDRVRDAVSAMSAGAVAVVENGGRLVGIFTDGDLRRRVSDGVNLADLQVVEVMTPDPVHVFDTDLAVEILRVYEEHNIDDIVVVNAAHEVVGMVDIQDLPKLKIL